MSEVYFLFGQSKPWRHGKRGKGVVVGGGQGRIRGSEIRTIKERVQGKIKEEARLSSKVLSAHWVRAAHKAKSMCQGDEQVIERLEKEV